MCLFFFSALLGQIFSSDDAIGEVDAATLQHWLWNRSLMRKVANWWLLCLRQKIFPACCDTLFSLVPRGIPSLLKRSCVCLSTRKCLSTKMVAGVPVSKMKI